MALPTASRCHLRHPPRKYRGSYPPLTGPSERTIPPARPRREPQDIGASHTLLRVFGRLFTTFGILSARAFRVPARSRLSQSWLRRAVGAGALVLASFVWISAADQAVLWTNGVNVSIVNGSLKKTAGCDGCDDAGATSQQ